MLPFIARCYLMAKDAKKLQSQLYFIYKLNEYFRNYYHVLQNNRMESLQSILKECIVIQNDINNQKGDTTRLEKSLESQFKGLQFWFKTNPIAKHTTIASSIKILIEKLSVSKTDKLTIYHNISSLYKRIRQLNLVALHVDIIQQQNLCFSEVDLLLDSIVSELIFEGCSLKYLEEWYSKNIFKSDQLKKPNEDNISTVLDLIKNIVPPLQKFSVIFYTWLPTETTKAFTTKTSTGFLEHSIVDCEKLGIDGYHQTFGNKQQFYTLLTSVNALDKYKAIEVSLTSVENYLEVYRQLYNKHDFKTISDTHCYLSIDNKTWLKERISSDDSLFSGRTDAREKDDIKQFIDLRNKLSGQGIYASDILVLERVLFILNKSTELSLENRLLNLWSALEYILAFHHKGSIIQKVIEITPKVLCLYYIKDKMNTLWDRLIRLRDYSKNPALNTELDALISECRKELYPDKYVKERFASYLSSDKPLTLYKLLTSKVVIQRDLAEVHELLTKPDRLKERLDFVNQAISHDLTRIYRVRNKIVHSGNQIDDNLEVITGRLYRYLNSMRRPPFNRQVKLTDSSVYHRIA